MTSICWRCHKNPKKPNEVLCKKCFKEENYHYEE